MTVGMAIVVTTVLLLVVLMDGDISPVAMKNVYQGGILKGKEY